MSNNPLIYGSVGRQNILSVILIFPLFWAQNLQRTTCHGHLRLCFILMKMKALLTFPSQLDKRDRSCVTVTDLFFWGSYCILIIYLCWKMLHQDREELQELTLTTLIFFSQHIVEIPSLQKRADRTRKVVFNFADTNVRKCETEKTVATINSDWQLKNIVVMGQNMNIFNFIIACFA